MLKVGFVGWRGMVGSVLMNSMNQSKDFDKIDTYFFSTSAPNTISEHKFIKNNLLDAYSIEELSEMDCIVSTRGSDYSKAVLPKLQSINWKGYWLDTASVFRMNEDAVIALDPINSDLIYKNLNNGTKIYTVGNCSAIIMLMALAGLLKNNLVEWVSAATYQAASGVGINHLKELLLQYGYIYNSVAGIIEEKDILTLDTAINNSMKSNAFPKKHFGVPLAGSLIPWIDIFYNKQHTKEEYKMCGESIKILGYNDNQLKIESTCTRVGVIRCHSQALTVKLKHGISMEMFIEILHQSHEWIKIIPNNKESTVNELTPAMVNGTLDIAIGRIKQLSFGKEYFSLFVVGDQLLWGAAEPLRRMLKIIINL